MPQEAVDFLFVVALGGFTLLGERVDFTERLLAKQRDPERLARGDR